MGRDIVDGRRGNARFGADRGAGKAADDGADGAAEQAADHGARGAAAGGANDSAGFSIGLDADDLVLGDGRKGSGERKCGHGGQKKLFHFS
ncbi:hypothetical protein D9M68_1006120 [compost metagenome]